MLGEKAIFVHIPKTAGQSIDRALRESSGLDWLGGKELRRLQSSLRAENSDLDPGPPRLAHLKAYQYISCGFVTEEEFHRRFKFSFVRNPWDRLVSEYVFRRHFLRYDYKSFLLEHFPDDGHSDRYVHVVPQYEFLYDRNGQCLVDFVGRFENLQSDFEKVCHCLGIEDAELPHQNRARSKRLPLWRVRSLVRWHRRTRRHYTEYYDQETIDFVRHVYLQDIETFGYEFGES